MAGDAHKTNPALFLGLFEPLPGASGTEDLRNLLFTAQIMQLVQIQVIGSKIAQTDLDISFYLFLGVHPGLGCQEHFTTCLLYTSRCV